MDVRRDFRIRGNGYEEMVFGELGCGTKCGTSVDIWVGFICLMGIIHSAEKRRNGLISGPFQAICAF